MNKRQWNDNTIKSQNNLKAMLALIFQATCIKSDMTVHSLSKTILIGVDTSAKIEFFKDVDKKKDKKMRAKKGHHYTLSLDKISLFIVR